jgi:hypothetical protein
MEYTPRPRIVIDDSACLCVVEERAKAMRRKLPRTHAMSRAFTELRLQQRNLLCSMTACSKRAAVSLSTDPYPYTKSYIFYCLR